MIKGKKGKLLVNLLVLLVTIVFFLIVFEIFLRVVIKVPVPPARFIPDRYTEYRLQPDSTFVMRSPDFSTPTTINSLGIRDNELRDLEKKEYRILMLGDSLTFGNGVLLNDTFSQLIEKRLQKKTGKDIEVINAGTGGYGTVNEMKYLRHYGFELFNPDMVIVNYFVGNDLSDNLRKAENFTVMSGYLVSIKSLTLMNRIKFFLFAHSRTAVFLGRIINDKLAYDKKGDELPLDFKQFIKDQEDAEIEEGWNLTFAALEEIKKMTDEKEIPFILVIIPMKEQVYNHFFENAKENFNLKQEQLDMTLVNTKLVKFAQEQNITILDLHEPFKEAKEQGLYFEIDSHMSQEGHSITAEKTYPLIIKEIKEKVSVEQ
ncbi:SGNH/GDSL hydrolase family protein [Candidatus Woesearchaeota archaeon]|nr:SGNH/GDSL hydrolase family protein [Candidatus Woesearchaeota archaeon]